MARKTVLGFPVGKRKRSVPSLGKLAGAAAAVAAPAIAIPAARKVAPAAKKAAGTAQKGEQLVSQGTQAVKTAGAVKDAVASQSSTVGKVGAAVKALAGGGGGAKPKLSHLLEQHADIGVPRSVAYNQWTQLEMFPRIVKGIESVTQEEDDKTTWTSKIGPSRRKWTGKIVEQVPDERIAWKHEGGASVQGVVTFHSLAEDLTRVLVQIEYKPSGPVEWVGNTLRIQRRRVKRDLRLFQHFIELRGEETGGWRGTIDKQEGLTPKDAGQADSKAEAGSKAEAKDAGKPRSASKRPGSDGAASSTSTKRAGRAVAASARPRRSSSTAAAGATNGKDEDEPKESGQAGSKSTGSKSPGSKSTGSKSPGSKSPGSKATDSKATGSKSPGTGKPRSASKRPGADGSAPSSKRAGRAVAAAARPRRTSSAAAAESRR
jgi:uncharacterized membrane protein